MGLSIPHLAVVLAIVILLFGTKHLRNMGADLGGAVKGFRDAMNAGETEKQGVSNPAFPVDKDRTEQVGK